MRILGIDPGTLRLGYGVIDFSPSRLQYVECGVISASPRVPRTARLHTIGRALRELLEEVSPDAVALEEAFYGKNGSPITWEEYKQRYLEEMKQQEALIKQIAAVVAEGKTITLLCSSACKDAAHCHRTLLKELIEAEVAKLQPDAPPAAP